MQFSGGGEKQTLNPQAIYQFNINSDFEIGHAGSMAMETPWITFSTPFQLIWYNSKRIWTEEGFGLTTIKFCHSYHSVFTCVPYSEDGGDEQKVKSRAMGERNNRAPDKICRL